MSLFEQQESSNPFKIHEAPHQFCEAKEESFVNNFNLIILSPQVGQDILEYRQADHQFLDQAAPNGTVQEIGTPQTGKWSKLQHVLFLKYYEKHPDDWKLISQTIKTRTIKQVRSHAQKYLVKLQKCKEALMLQRAALQQKDNICTRSKLVYNRPIQKPNEKARLKYLKKKQQKEKKERREARKKKGVAQPFQMNCLF